MNERVFFEGILDIFIHAYSISVHVSSTSHQEMIPPTSTPLLIFLGVTSSKHHTVFEKLDIKLWRDEPHFWFLAQMLSEIRYILSSGGVEEVPFLLHWIVMKNIMNAICWSSGRNISNFFQFTIYGL